MLLICPLHRYLMLFYKSEVVPILFTSRKRHIRYPDGCTHYAMLCVDRDNASLTESWFNTKKPFINPDSAFQQSFQLSSFYNLHSQEWSGVHLRRTLSSIQLVFKQRCFHQSNFYLVEPCVNVIMSAAARHRSILVGGGVPPIQKYRGLRRGAVWAAKEFFSNIPEEISFHPKIFLTTKNYRWRRRRAGAGLYYLVKTSFINPVLFHIESVWLCAELWL